MQIAFFGGNFLGLSQDHIRELLNEAGLFIKAGKVDGIRFSTRPDTIDREKLEIIKPFPISTIELGVQSMNDHVLNLSRRGHTSADTEKAVDLLKKCNYELGLQIMVGLPGDSDESALNTTVKIAELQPGFVRIYPTVVLKNSLLAKWYNQGKYFPLSLESSIRLVKTLFLYLKKKNIVVIRMGLQASEDFDASSAILAGPYHPCFGHLVYSEIFLDRVREMLDSQTANFDLVKIRVYPRSIPKLRGFKNRNIKKLMEEYKIRSIKLIPDPYLSEDQVILDE